MAGIKSSSLSSPSFPFGEIEIVNLGGRLHGPMPGWGWETTFSYYNFWFLIQGEGRLRCRDREYLLEPGICFLFPPGMPLAAWSASPEPFLNFSVHFHPRPRTPIPKAAIDRLFGRKVHQVPLFLDLARHAADVYKRGDALGLRQLELASLQMMMHLWREASSPPPKEKDDRIVQMLSEAGRKGGDDIPGLARKVGLSPSQFTRRVRALTGMAPAAYLIRDRIGHACSLLTGTSQSVNDVAETLGYSDPSYFVRQFQGVMKTTPARFRRQALD